MTMEARSIVLRERKGERERKEGERTADFHLLIEVRASAGGHGQSCDVAADIFI